MTVEGDEWDRLARPGRPLRRGRRRAAERERALAEIAAAIRAVDGGDLATRLATTGDPAVDEVVVAFNAMTEHSQAMSAEMVRTINTIVDEGRLSERAAADRFSGPQSERLWAVNRLVDSLVRPVAEIARVLDAVAAGDLTQRVTVDAPGDLAGLARTINMMVEQLSTFADEVVRVAREVGVEGKLGGQAEVDGVSGTWRRLTENVNLMASNLTSQVRSIADVTTAVAEGDLSKKIDVDARGEILELKRTINTMVDQLGAFAAEVTRVAREVGTEGKLGGQAEVEGVSGTWRRLTDSVNQLAGNLTTQVRAIAEVATAVTDGDLTRTVSVDASGEVADLKDNINEMIANLRDTTIENAEQDWLKSNMARISALMQGQRDLQAVSRLVMSELTPLVSAQHGAFYLAESVTDDGTMTPIEVRQDDYELRLIASYGFRARKGLFTVFRPGEGLVGQAALEGAAIVITDPPDNYVRISSGLGEAAPRSIIVLPVLFEGQVLAVLEMASFREFSSVEFDLLEQTVETIGVVLNTITANMRTEALLEGSQALAEELGTRTEQLQRQQDELRVSNQELAAQTEELRASEELLQDRQETLRRANEALEEQAAELAQRNGEVELARAGLEDKAGQLALSSRYKSEFLANMSHELRTPLNSLLILAKLLADNPEGNLTGKQQEFARTIHGAGSDLLNLINDILDLSKVEAGRMEVAATEVPVQRVVEALRRSFEPVATERAISLRTEVAPDVPELMLVDEGRLGQILRNLLSNAFKFTERGEVGLRIDRARPEEVTAHPSLQRAETVLAFRVRDSGIGIPSDKLDLVFEAFQQADGTTSRRYGGTGLGLSISREMAALLGGTLHVRSTVGEGSEFTLLLAARWTEGAASPRPADPWGGPFAAGPRARSSSGRLERSSPVPELPAGGPSADEATAVAEPKVAAGSEAAAEAGVATPDAPGGPGRRSGAAAALADRLDPSFLRMGVVADDRDTIGQVDRVVLIVDDDPRFAAITLDAVRARGLKGVVAARGDSGLALARRVRPDVIVLDMALPGVDGIDVLGHLSRHPDTRHIPVHVVCTEDHRRRALWAGAASYRNKPLTGEQLDGLLDLIGEDLDRRLRPALLVDPDPGSRAAVAELIGGDDVDLVTADSVDAAAAALEARPFSCVVVDLGVDPHVGMAVLDRMVADGRWCDVPVVVHADDGLPAREQDHLRGVADALVLKEVGSAPRLLDETARHLHRSLVTMQTAQREMLEHLSTADAGLRGRRVLIVDDDVRNVFALANALEVRGMEVLFADDGLSGVRALTENDGIELVLMDVMMPGLDGLAAMRRIRADTRFSLLPIIAVSAKAMEDDCRAALAAGASDYVTKPVDVDALLSLIRVWLSE